MAGLRYCIVCHKLVTKVSWLAHSKTAKHKLAQAELL